MKHLRNLGSPNEALFVVIVILAFVPAVQAASTYKMLHPFVGARGGQSPDAGLTFDAVGNLYGTTTNGGDIPGCLVTCGTVFRLSPNADGSWTESVLWNFSGLADGGYPTADLIFDTSGNLYGTTVDGGDTICHCGVVFKLTPQPGGSWTETVLHAFTGTDGEQPEQGVIFDASGNLYGTTRYGGGACSCGVVFELSPQPDGSWTQSVLYTFTGAADGGYPIAVLVFDGSGNLYGTAGGGGIKNNGVVFKLTPNSGGSWTEGVVHSFTGADGSSPYAGVIFDSSGNLYGTTPLGGNLSDCDGGGCGVVFKLTPNPDGSWTESVLHGFPDASPQPFGALIFDAAGNLYSTVSGGVTSGGGVFKLAPQAGGGWAYSVLHVFLAKPAENPYDRLVLDGAGNLYGTAYGCGPGYTCGGAVFEVTP